MKSDSWIPLVLSVSTGFFAVLGLFGIIAAWIAILNAFSSGVNLFSFLVEREKEENEEESK